MLFMFGPIIYSDCYMGLRYPEDLDNSPQVKKQKEKILEIWNNHEKNKKI